MSERLPKTPSGGPVEAVDRLRLELARHTTHVVNEGTDISEVIEDIRDVLTGTYVYDSRPEVNAEHPTPVALIAGALERIAFALEGIAQSIPR